MSDPYDFLDDPLGWASKLVLDHARQLTGEGPRVEQDATATQPTGSRTTPTAEEPPPSPVKILILNNYRSHR